ncbi:tRNA-modifying protein YgfZ [Celerinatantimonas sp. MCCC 1A17872]|uniref:tRNA-modifying protein YgfZ n=1 Tax=Celerinatantimonas sp. MCCC 1A17872 TaxID=3177514 RepID=UPI0038C2A87F
MELDKLSTFENLRVGPLTDWSLTRISGADRLTYLQGQLTAEVQGLAQGAQTLSGHCDPKGKLWSVIRLINAGEWIWMLQPASAKAVQLPELKKYSVFSKVNIEDEAQFCAVAVIGKQAKAFIEQHFGAPIAAQGGLLEEGYCLSYAAQPMRYLLIVPQAQAQQLYTDESSLDELWQGLDIVAGLASITKPTSNEFIPQALNLHLLDAISFTKGCYTGQEVVARAKYRGTNKRATMRFVGQSSQEIENGSDIEMSLNGNWRRCGTVLNSYRQSDGYTEILAVVRKDSEADQDYRLEGQEQSHLTLAHLPYSLDES